MTSLELDEEAQGNLIVMHFLQQNYKKNLEELKNIAEKYVKFTEKQNEYEEFKVKDTNINYKYTGNTVEIKNWHQYIMFLLEVQDLASLVNFIQKNKLDETPWYKKVWVWLLIVLTILCVRYSMIKVKK